MLHRIRLAMQTGSWKKMGSPDVPVEADETFGGHFGQAYFALAGIGPLRLLVYIAFPKSQPTLRATTRNCLPKNRHIKGNARWA
jgi:hypothetical protein